MILPSLTDKQEIINKSWLRCQNKGFSPDDSPNIQIITPEFLKELHLENEKLCYYAIPVFQKLIPFLKLTGQLALLTDHIGRIVYSLGDMHKFQEVKSHKLDIGINWKEELKGTSAVCIALAEKKPIILLGMEHYFKENHYFSCAASPIFAPNGNLLGVINITGTIDDFSPSSLPLALMAAESIQNRIFLDEEGQKRIYAINELKSISARYQQALVAVDNDRNIIHSNEAARKLLGTDCVGRTFKEDKTKFSVEVISDTTNKFWTSFVLNPHSKQKYLPGQNYTFDSIIGKCSKIKQSIDLAKKVAITDIPILLSGESGTGKELFAQSIHNASLRSYKPFIAINCSAIPENLIESELFGYQRGAFTGANQTGNVGKFEAANGGTLFLDEIGDMSLRAQSALLRVLQEKLITPVGSTKSKPIDVRIIAATHRNLTDEIQAANFRADLYYRLKGIQINLPPLRERSDILELAEHLLNQTGNETKKLSPKAQELIVNYPWPGNIRELNSLLIQASILSEGEEIEPHHLHIQAVHTPQSPDQQIPDKPCRSKESERSLIQNALETCQWNKKKAAKLLKIGRNTLYRKIEKYNIQPI